MLKSIVTSLLLMTVSIAGTAIWIKADPLSLDREATAIQTVERLAAGRNIYVPLIKNNLDQSSVVEVNKHTKKIVTLEASNTVSLNGAVTSQSMAVLMDQISKMDQKLEKDTPIYLVLNTPGGSVFAGLDFIDFIKSLDRKVHTITLFAASMGFQIAQNLDDRMITNHGILMSHRAAGGVEGQFDGELESRYRMIKRSIDYLDVIAANRLKVTLKDYKASIVNELWITGFDSIDENAADSIAAVRCGESLNGTKEQMVRTFFGNLKVTTSNCPIIKGVLAVKNVSIAPSRLAEVQKNITNSIETPSLYLKSHIKTGKHYKLFP